MKVTYNWLKDFVEIKIFPQKLAEKLTMAGLEVTSLEERDGDFVFEMEVTSNRPDWLSVIGIAREVAAITGKKLKLTQVAGRRSSLGSARDRQVAGKNLQPAACSLQPISIRIEDKKDCPLYTAKIIENVKVGPSPDWLKKRLELVGCRSVNNIVDITNYVLFESGEPLHAFDLDKIVGQLASGLVGRLNIIIRRAKNGEEITTIDGIKRVLNDNILVIASENVKTTGRPANRQTGKPIAIAGVIGGRDTEVTASTKNILLEAAIFNPIVIRRARQGLGLQSESSYRFERGIGIETVEKASLRAVELIEEVAGGNLASSSKISSLKLVKKKIKLEVPRVNTVLGTGISLKEIKEILESLGFKISPVRDKTSKTSVGRLRQPVSNGVKAKNKSRVTVEVPSHRQDVNQEADLVEEIARIYGYENIPTTLPKAAPRVKLNGPLDRILLIKNMLVGLGVQEVITFSLIDKELSAHFESAGSGEQIEILNPLSQEQGVLRSNLALSLAPCVGYNLRQKQTSVNIFEIAKTYGKHNSEIKEQYSLGIALAGKKLRWYGKEYVRAEDEMGFLHLKGILESVFNRLGIKKNEYNFSVGDRSFNIQVKGKKLGSLIKLSNADLETLDIKNKDVFIAEILLDELLSCIGLDKHYLVFSRYPGVYRDISMVLKEKIAFEEILRLIKEAGGELLKEARLIDYYKGKHIEQGSKGLTVSCFYCSDQRTLSEADIEQAHSAIINSLKQRLGAGIR